MAEWGEVLDVTELRQLDEKQDLVSVYRYRVKSKKGTIFTELVKEADTKPEIVTKILSEKAQRLDKAFAL